jgi:hypothetical protein
LVVEIGSWIGKTISIRYSFMKIGTNGPTAILISIKLSSAQVGLAVVMGIGELWSSKGGINAIRRIFLGNYFDPGWLYW